LPCLQAIERHPQRHTVTVPLSREEEELLAEGNGNGAPLRGGATGGC
jgi:hypothetical protein